MNDSGMWQFAEKWFRSVSCKATEYADHVDIEYLYELPVTENAQMVIKHKEYAPCGSDHGNDLKGIVIPVTYSVYADGHMVVKTTYPGAGNLPELPLFGMQFVFNKDAEEYTYYGKGPWENYRDRNNGARYGVFTQNATDDLTDYIIPQGCGNRTEVRELTVKCPEGEITFEATDAPLETTVLHYNETQLEEAYHKEELNKEPEPEPNPVPVPVPVPNPEDEKVNQLFQELDEDFGIAGFMDEDGAKAKIRELNCDKEKCIEWIEGNLMGE